MFNTDTAATDDQKTAIERALAMHTGSLERTRHWTRRFIYTPGVEDMAETCRAYWLIDLIASFCRNRRLIGEPFQVWTLSVQTDHSATLSAGDGNAHELFSRGIHRTDFPLDEIKLYLDQGTLMLPGEY